MKSTRIALAMIVLIGGCWMAVRYYQCKKRSAHLTKELEDFVQEARETLKVGTKQTELARFFETHHANLRIVESEAYGTIETNGCAPLVCGSDAAIINIQVRLDQTGAVADPPLVNAMYTKCP